ADRAYGARVVRSFTGRVYGEAEPPGDAQGGKSAGGVDESATGSANLWSGSVRRDARVDLSRERLDPLGQLLVLAGQVGVRREQRLQLVRLALQRDGALFGVAENLLAMRLEHVGRDRVPFGLPRLREQD